MEIRLTKRDVFEILASHFGFRTITTGAKIEILEHTIYWEGNEEIREDKTE